MEQYKGYSYNFDYLYNTERGIILLPSLAIGVYIHTPRGEQILKRLEPPMPINEACQTVNAFIDSRITNLKPKVKITPYKRSRVRIIEQEVEYEY